ncbi:MAG TPA: YraN family protein [Solirubrobacteraceae bacterium]|nr:YraN family protein [Solirubrobacteraceae bacterium]
MQTPHRQHLGRLGERLAAEHFARLGFSVLAQNHHTRFGELDLVLSDGRTLVFCEVKTRRLGSGEPFDSLHPSKRSQVRKIAAQWLSEPSDRPWHEELRFDAIGVLVDREDGLVRLDHVENAF